MKHKFEKFCKNSENIENYQKAKADNFKGWCCHHRKGVDIPTEELKALGMYYNRPPEELIFLTRSEHTSLHQKGEKNNMYGKHHSDDANKKNSEAHKGKHHSSETKKKIAEAMKGNNGKHHSAETKKKIAEAARVNSMGRHWFNNGKENKFCYECPDGFVPGMLK